MSKNQTLLILNPVAAKNRAGERREEIETALSARNIAFETRLTTAVWHAAGLARGAGAEGFTTIIAAGGDGTMNEVINGLMLAKADGGRIPDLGVLPVGRGNDFAFGMGLPSDLGEAADLIASGRKGPLDVGFVKGGDYPLGRFFGNGLGVGFDALVGFAAAKITWVHGPLTYTLGALRIFALFPDPVDVRLHFDSLDYEGRSHQISIMNGRRMGGAYYMAPEALVDDGLLDFCIVGDVSRREMAALIMRYTKGRQKGRPKVTMGRAASFLIEAPRGGLAVHADGETICERGRSVAVECRAGALTAYGLGGP
ncbi:MAG: YegS/Rv2252/BmrU family lipid kinase [Spirochaetota bacterium]